MAFDPVKLKGTDPIHIASCGESGEDWIIFEVGHLEGEFAGVPQMKFTDSPDSVPQDCGYYDMLRDHKVTIPAGTPMTKPSVYGVFAQGMSLFVKPTQGTATLKWMVPK